MFLWRLPLVLFNDILTVLPAWEYFFFKIWYSHFSVWARNISSIGYKYVISNTSKTVSACASLRLSMILWGRYVPSTSNPSVNYFIVFKEIQSFCNLIAIITVCNCTYIKCSPCVLLSQQILTPWHYFSLLPRKPQILWNVTFAVPLYIYSRATCEISCTCPKLSKC